MEQLSSGDRDLLSIGTPVITAAELIAALGEPFDEEDADLLRSMGIAPIETDVAQ